LFGGCNFAGLGEGRFLRVLAGAALFAGRFHRIPAVSRAGVLGVARGVCAPSAIAVGPCSTRDAVLPDGTFPVAAQSAERSAPTVWCAKAISRAVRTHAFCPRTLWERLGVTPARTAAAAIGEKVAAASGQPGVTVPVERKRCHARDCAPHDWPIDPDRTCVRPGAVVLGARRVHFAARAFVQRAPALCC
jgi:hypothetical protein